MKDIPIDDINYILNHEQTVIDGYNQDSIETEFELTSQDFLKFSESDLISESVHKYINALSNAKRALDCQLDTLLIGFGYYKITKDKNLGFPAKITFLKEVGIICKLP